MFFRSRELKALHTRINQLESTLRDISNNLPRQIEDISRLNRDYTERRSKEFQEAILKHLTIRTEEILTQSLAVSRRFHEDEQRDREDSIAGLSARLFREIDTFRRELERSLHSDDPTSPLDSSAYSPSISESMYVALEDQFRGEQQHIKERQRLFVHHFEFLAHTRTPLLDIGCGRGEWLEILRECDIRGIGIDVNSLFVLECKEKGLDASHTDALSYLAGAPSESLGGMTLFQVAEHLELSTLLDILREGIRVLIPGGKILLEFPNIETLSVGASTFWIDPTHLRPLHPGIVEMLARKAGFVDIKREYSLPVRQLPDRTARSHEIDRVIEELFDAVFGPGDVAIILTR